MRLALPQCHPSVSRRLDWGEGFHRDGQLQFPTDVRDFPFYPTKPMGDTPRKSHVMMIAGRETCTAGGRFVPAWPFWAGWGQIERSGVRGGTGHGAACRLAIG